MSQITKMSIRGIRSFSPDEAANIEFFTPLTVIVGQNGCGKTTTIECLKYVTSGTLPPNSKSGQSFVYDPNMYGESEVKACVKLRFKDNGGKTHVAGKHNFIFHPTNIIHV